jgi:catecholate siderophore receptor
MHKRWVVMGAVMASATFSSRFTAPAKAAEVPRSRYDQAIAELLARRRNALTFPPSWEAALDSWRHSATADAQNRPALRFDIQPGRLSDVLAAFERSSGIEIRIATDAIRDIQSAGVTGVFTPEQALDRLLAGTGAGFTFSDLNVVTVDLAAVREFVAVTGRTPTVDSPKYTQPLRDIPQTINVIPQTVMQQQGATTLRDVLRNVPGITFQAGEGGVPAGDALTIRGFSARTDMFIDGVRDFGGYSRDSFNLEQVEVAKGPSSAIAGRGSTGGSINQVSKAPYLGRAVFGTLGAGNADYRRGTLDVNQPLGSPESGVALRVNAMWTDSGVPGRDVVKSERWGVAPSLAVGLDKRTRATISHLHLTQDNIPEYGLPWVPANTNPQLAAHSNSQPPVDSSNFYGLRARDYEDTTTDVSTVQVDHSFNDRFTLRNTSRYGRNVRDSVITAPRFAAVNTSTAINRQLQSRDMTDTIVANNTNTMGRFASGSLLHAISAGIELSREASENFARVGPAAPQADLFNPNPSDPYPGPIVRSGARTKGVATSAAAYAFDTVNLTPQVELTGGLRWERFDVDYESVAVGGVTTPFERTDEMVSWRGAAVFKPMPNASVFAGVSTSFNPSAEGLALTAATVTLEPEKTRNFEVGSKWDLMQNRVSLSASLFRTEKTNARTPGVNPGDPPTVLAGEQQVSGAELGISGRVTDKWLVIGGYAFMKSTIEASNTPAEIDNALALTPNHTFNLWTTYDLPWHLSIGGGAQYMDAVFRNATNTATVPSYWLVNGLASYDVNSHLTLRLNMQNLTDEVYVDRIGGGHYIPGPRRQVMLTTDVKF